MRMLMLSIQTPTKQRRRQYIPTILVKNDRV
jgi:hypothetical protein